jgi:hypothetical protein
VLSVNSVIYISKNVRNLKQLKDLNVVIKFVPEKNIVTVADFKLLICNYIYFYPAKAGSFNRLYLRRIHWAQNTLGSEYAGLRIHWAQNTLGSEKVRVSFIRDIS